MLLRVTNYNTKKGKAVWLFKSLPNNKSFGNKHELPANTKGYIMSEGFVLGRLKVSFDTYSWGNQVVEFNTESAANFLVTDVF